MQLAIYLGVLAQELVEMFLQPLEDSGHDAEITQRLVGQVQACDHGVYTLSYAMAERGRYELFVRIAGKDVFGSPFRVVVAPGCRSGNSSSKIDTLLCALRL